MAPYACVWITKVWTTSIPLVSDLLDAPRKAWIYLKIDLRSTYHLVPIVQDDK